MISISRCENLLLPTFLNYIIYIYLYIPTSASDVLLVSEDKYTTIYPNLSSSHLFILFLGLHIPGFLISEETFYPEFCFFSMKTIPFILLSIHACHLWGQSIPYTFDEAKAQMVHTSSAIKASDAQVQMAHEEQRKASALWWPQLQGEGMYAHLSEEIEVRQPLSQFTTPAKEYVQSLIPSEQLVSGLLDEIGQYTLTFPLIPQNIASVGLTAEWIAFSGGKRLLARRMAQQLTQVAQTARKEVQAIQITRLTERYYALVLATEATAVCRERSQVLQQHYADAIRLETAGLIDKAMRLSAQVAMEEAERELQHALTTEQVEQQALKCLLGINSESSSILPTSPLTPLVPLLPESDYQTAVLNNNYGLHTLNIEEQMAQAELRMGQSDYLPDIAIFGKQTLYAHGLPSNLLPRTIVGIGFTWNLFDGLHRERQIAQSRLEQQSLAYTREHTASVLATTVSELYATLTRTLADTRVLTSTISLNEELARMRRIAFAEGMATSTEVVDAENALSQARLDLLSAYYLYRITLTNLQALCGII